MGPHGHCLSGGFWAAPIRPHTGPLWACIGPARAPPGEGSLQNIIALGWTGLTGLGWTGLGWAGRLTGWAWLTGLGWTGLGYPCWANRDWLTGLGWTRQRLVMFFFFRHQGGGGGDRLNR